MNIQFFDSGVKLKKSMLSIGVAMALGMTAVSAQATIYNLGPVGLANLTQDVWLPADGSFSDVFNFSLNNTASQIAITTYFNGVAAPYLTYTLKSDNILVTPVTTDYGTSEVGNISYGKTFGGLVQGKSYSLTVDGSEAINLGNSYAFQIAAVPEPESYALLLAGLGLIGTIIRRRKAI